MSEIRAVIIGMCPRFPCPLSGTATESKATGANGYVFHTLPMPTCYML